MSVWVRVEIQTLLSEIRGKMAPSHPIIVLAKMVKDFDKKEPKPGRETTAFIKDWKAKELKEHHNSQIHLDIALHKINRVEIQNIRETKHFRDDRKKGIPCNSHKRKGGRASMMPTGKRQPLPKVDARSVRNVIW